jgi:uncharacterized protein
VRILDFHTHLTDKWFDLPMITEAEYLEGMDRVGIEAACIFTLMGFYHSTREENDRLASRASVHPDRFIPFITVDPKEGDASVREMERCLANPIFRGVKFHNWVQSFPNSLVKPTMVKILRLAAERGVPTLFHDGTPPYSTTFQIADVARWVPEATIVLGHGGLADYVVAAGQLVRDIPNLHVCFCGPRVGDLLYLLDTGGPDKVIWGSDFGIAPWTLLAERLDDVLHAGLDEETLDKVLYRNAAKLLKWKSGVPTHA